MAGRTFAILLNRPDSRVLVFEARDMHLDFRCGMLRQLQAARRRNQLLRRRHPRLLQIPHIRPARHVRPRPAERHKPRKLIAILVCSAGIVPSNTTTYTLAQIQNAVKSQTGAVPFFGCGGSGASGTANHNILNEVWHFNHVLGTVRTPLAVVVLRWLISACRVVLGAIWSLQADRFYLPVDVPADGDQVPGAHAVVRARGEGAALRGEVDCQKSRYTCCST